LKLDVETGDETIGLIHGLNGMKAGDRLFLAESDEMSMWFNEPEVKSVLSAFAQYTHTQPQQPQPPK
jgi:hypothetical protein